jgi:hypothetical protein
VSAEARDGQVTARKNRDLMLHEALRLLLLLLPTAETPKKISSWNQT